jgi:diadenylate cyclase
MVSLFLQIRILDILDMLLVALIMYQLYMLVRGTVALNISIGILSIYLFWGIVKMLKMELLSTILGQFIGVGVIALIIVFQLEIRRFLLIIGTRYISNNRLRLENMFNLEMNPKLTISLGSIYKAVINLSSTKTGALIVIRRKSTLDIYAHAGDILDAKTSSRLLISIFNKLSPMHDGAVIIEGEKIHAARVILPVSENPNLPPEYGLRHRAAIAITELTDAFVIVVSEETGQISVAEGGVIKKGLSQAELLKNLEIEFQSV